LSVTWYTWIEQGAMCPSLLRHLRASRADCGLSRAERSYLFEVAGKRDSERRATGMIH